MKAKIAVGLLSLILLIALAVGAAAIYTGAKAETKFSTIRGKVHTYKRKVVEVKLEDLGKNLASKMEATANDFTQDKRPDTVTDGDAATYWEGAPDAYPNTLTVDLRSVAGVKAVRVKLNPDAIWEKRTQTFSVLGSTDGEKFTEIVPSAGYIFIPEENLNTTTIKFAETKLQYLRLVFTANTAATGGQAAEVEVY